MRWENGVFWMVTNGCFYTWWIYHVPNHLTPKKVARHCGGSWGFCQIMFFTSGWEVLSQSWNANRTSTSTLWFISVFFQTLGLGAFQLSTGWTLRTLQSYTSSPLSIMKLISRSYYLAIGDCELSQVYWQVIKKSSTLWDGIVLG